jgi:hypothetical protein
MDENRIAENNLRDFERNMHDFISVEVQAGLTFAEVALSNPKHRQEDTVKARKGYDTALRFIAKAQERFPEHPVASSSMERLEKLKQLLKQLGEHF